MSDNKDYSPKLKEAMEEINSIIKKYDIGAAVALHTPNFSEFSLHLSPSYSCAVIEEFGIRIKAKEADYPNGAQGRSESLANTSNMMNLLYTTMGSEAMQLMEISEEVDKIIGAEHK